MNGMNGMSRDEWAIGREQPPEYEVREEVCARGKTLRPRSSGVG